MEEYSYEYEVTYTVCVPVTAVTAGGRRAADTIAQTAVAKGLLRVLPEDLEKVTTEYMLRTPARRRARSVRAATFSGIRRRRCAMRIKTKTRKVIRPAGGPFTYMFDCGRRGRPCEVSVEAYTLHEAEMRLRRLVRTGRITWYPDPTMDFRFRYMTDEEHPDFLLRPNTECFDREDPEI